MNQPCATDIVNFWLGDSVQSPQHAHDRKSMWYQGGVALDDEIRSLFGERVSEAVSGALSKWHTSGEGALALVIMLDQFTRNMFRGTPEAYVGDQRAHAVACAAVDAGLDKSLPFVGRIFLYHPFHHSESLAEQNKGVALLEQMVTECDAIWAPYVSESVEGFKGHRDVVAQFGRFPHRNRTLNRESTPAEREYLDQGADRYGQ